MISTLSATAIAQEKASVKKPYNLVVWADLNFDETSQLKQIVIPAKDQLPAPFVSYLMTSIASGSFTKLEYAESNKQLETGLRVTVEIDPNTSKAKLVSQELMPRPVRIEQQSEPVLRVKGEWSGRILMTCTITTKGRCSKPRMDTASNAPNEISKVLMGTLGSWRFIPVKRAGVAVESEFNTWVTIEADTTMPPEEFGKQI